MREDRRAGSSIQIGNGDVMLMDMQMPEMEKIRFRMPNLVLKSIAVPFQFAAETSAVHNQSDGALSHASYLGKITLHEQRR